MKRLPVLLSAAVATLALLGLSACGSDETSTRNESTRTTTSSADGASDDTTSDDGDTGGATDEGSSATDTALVDRLVASMTAEDRTAFTGYSEDQARCYAEASIRIIGADRMEEAITRAEAAEKSGDDPFADGGLAYDDLKLTETEAAAVYDAAKGCEIDFRSMMIEAMMEDADDMPPAVRDCLTGAVTEDGLRSFMIGVMTGDADTPGDLFGSDFVKALMACDAGAGGG